MNWTPSLFCLLALCCLLVAHGQAEQSHQQIRQQLEHQR